MYPILLKIGPINIYAWGFMLAIAVIIAVVGISKIFARKGYDRDIVLDLVIIMVLAGVFGARVFYVLIYQWDVFISNPLIFFSFKGGIYGLVWYGGFLGGLIACLIYTHKKKYPFWEFADICAPFAALGYAIVRIGCFLNGCCYGKATNSIFGVVFPYIDLLPRHPTQLYSSATNLLIFSFLLWYLPRKKYTGQITIMYLFLYSIYRFVLEFFRDNLVMYGQLSTSQTYSVILFVVAIILFLWRRKYIEPDHREA